MVFSVVGVARNPFTDEVFEGPSYIPWTVFKLQIKVCVNEIEILKHTQYLCFIFSTVCELLTQESCQYLAN